MPPFKCSIGGFFVDGSLLRLTPWFTVASCADESETEILRQHNQKAAEALKKHISDSSAGTDVGRRSCDIVRAVRGISEVENVAIREISEAMWPLRVGRYFRRCGDSGKRIRLDWFGYDPDLPVPIRVASMSANFPACPDSFKRRRYGARGRMR